MPDPLGPSTKRQPHIAERPSSLHPQHHPQQCLSTSRVPTLRESPEKKRSPALSFWGHCPPTCSPEGSFHRAEDSNARREGRTCVTKRIRMAQRVFSALQVLGEGGGHWLDRLVMVLPQLTRHYPSAPPPVPGTGLLGSVQAATSPPHSNEALGCLLAQALPTGRAHTYMFSASTHMCSVFLTLLERI